MSHPGVVLALIKLNSLRPGSSILVKCVTSPDNRGLGSTLSTLLAFLLGEPVQLSYQSIDGTIVSWTVSFPVVLWRYADEQMLYGYAVGNLKARLEVVNVIVLT